jgi:hypothetical protein
MAPRPAVLLAKKVQNMARWTERPTPCKGVGLALRLSFDLNLIV